MDGRYSDFTDTGQMDFVNGKSVSELNLFFFFFLSGLSVNLC